MVVKLIIGLILLVLLVGCTPVNDELNVNCSLEPETGPCKALFIQYYYNSTEGVCKEFKWGGCEGVVPFKTLDECKQVCE
jgi:hypothetical protein